MNREPLPLLHVIAIDGPAGSGKSTTAREVARRLGWQYIDTGAMYRALALAVLRTGGDPEDAAAVRPVLAATDVALEPGDPPKVMLNGEDVSESIRTPRVSQGASQVSVHGFVRGKMVELQRALGLKRPSVLEGRDITTVVFPDAGLKIYLDASVEVRARRRLRDYEAQGKSFSLDEVIEDLKQRDDRDRNRADGPLTRAADAVVVDTTDLDIEGQIMAVLDEARKRFSVEAGR